MDIIYFELNNWFPGRDYPAEEPFLSWLSNDFKIMFNDIKWVKENELVVVKTYVDMSTNFCITAPIKWVKANCPSLLTKYTNLIRISTDEDPPCGRFDSPFLEYTKDNIGIHEYSEYEDNEGYMYYVEE